MTKPKNLGGRPKKTRIPAAALDVMKAMERGLSKEQACKASGISRRTFIRWQKRWPELRKLSAEALAKQREQRQQEAVDVLAAQRTARLKGEEPEREWRVPSCVKGLMPQGALAPGEVRWFGLETNFLSTYKSSRNPQYEEVFIGLDGKR